MTFRMEGVKYFSTLMIIDYSHFCFKNSYLTEHKHNIINY